MTNTKAHAEISNPPTTTPTMIHTVAFEFDFFRRDDPDREPPDEETISPQKRHFRAASLISSPQAGQSFMVLSICLSRA
jgi:hypothetical protein